MKAAINTKYGPPEVVKVAEVAKPSPESNEVLIKIHASTVNRTDCGFRSADYFISRFWSGLLKPKFKTLGCEFAGEIEAIGEQVKSWKIGDRVVGNVIDYTCEDFTKTGQLFDFVFDAVGKSSFKQCKSVLKKGGIYISTELGKNAENIFLALSTPIFCSKKVLFPIPTITKEDVEFLKKLAESGHYKPVIDRTYHLEQIVEAHRYVGTGRKTGNVVIEIIDKSEIR